MAPLSVMVGDIAIMAPVCEGTNGLAVVLLGFPSNGLHHMVSSSMIYVGIGIELGGAYQALR